MRKPKKHPVKIQGLVWDVLRRKGYENVVKEQQILQQWAEIVGEKIAEQTQPSDIKNKCLFVQVRSASWRNELVFLKQQMIQKINDFAGKQVVKNIIFTREK